MGELTGELAEGYKRLMEKKKKAGDSPVEDASNSAASNKSAVLTTVPKKRVAATVNSIEAIGVAVAVTPAPSSTSSAQTTTGSSSSDNKLAAAAAAPLRRRSNPRSFINNRSKDRLAKFHQHRNSLTTSSQKDKENKANSSSATTAQEDVDMKDEVDDKLSHVSSTVSSTTAGSSMQHVSSTTSVETRRMANTSSAAADAAAPTPTRGSTNLGSSKDAAKESNDTDVSFDSLDWKELERDAKSVSSSSHNNASEENITPRGDNVSDTSGVSSSVHSDRQLNAILEEQAEAVLEGAAEKKAKADDVGFAETYEAIQCNAEDARVSPPGDSRNASNSHSRSSGANRVARAYHRPHTGEKVVIIDHQKETVQTPLSLVQKSDIEKDDGDSKSDTSGLPSWASLPSEKSKSKSKKSWSNRRKRRPKKVAANSSRKGRKGGDPLGRAVSIAFDQIAGYAGMQEDVQSITATEVNDEYTVDEEYSSDESENIIADIHDAIFSAFGCSVNRSKHRQLNDDDTLETDNGSKISLEETIEGTGKFIRHTGSHASDSMCSEPSLNIPSMPSYDEKTDEGTLEDDATGSLAESKRQPKSHLSSKSFESAPKYKVPDVFDDKPPSIPRSRSFNSKKSPTEKASVYSDNTDTYRKFVENDHAAVNLLSEADNFFLGNDAKKEILKCGEDLKKNMGELVASILNPGAPKTSQDGMSTYATGSATANDVSTLNDTIQGEGTMDSAYVEEPPLDTKPASNDSGLKHEPSPKKTDLPYESTIAEESTRVEECAVMEAFNDTKEPLDDAIAAENPLERSDSLFATEPKSVRLDSSSEAGSDNTLEEIKLMLIEEARAMAPIDFASESAVSTAAEEEKKEEDEASKPREQEDFVEEFEFDETLFTQAHHEAVQESDFSPMLDAQPVAAAAAFGSEIEFGETETVEDNIFQPNLAPVDDEFPDVLAESEIDFPKSVAEEIEVTNDDEIVEPSKPGDEAVATDELSSDAEQNLAGEGIEFEDALDSNIEIPVEPKAPASLDDGNIDQAEEPLETSFESVEVPVESLPSPLLPKEKARPVLEKKKKKGVLKGLFNSFRINKDPNQSKSKSSKAAKTRKSVLAKKAPKTVVDLKQEQAPTKSTSAKKTSTPQRQRSSAPSKKASAAKRTPTSSVNNLMDAYLSEKFDNPAGACAKDESFPDPWGGTTAISASEVPKQRTEAVPLVFPEPLDGPVTPDRMQHEQKVDQFGFAISSVPNDVNAETDFQAWGVPGFSSSDMAAQIPSVFRRDTGSRSSDEGMASAAASGMQTPERTRQYRIPNTPVNWASVQDSANEGIDLQAESKSTSSTGYSQPPSINWGAVIEKSGKASQAPETSPQKVSDFPDVESVASF